MPDPILPTIREIQEAVWRAYGVPVLDMLSQRRSMPVVRVRQIAMWLCRHATLHSLPEIGRAFGDRDHTTVMHAIRRVDTLMTEAPAFSADVWALLDRVNSVNSGEIRRARMRLVG